MKLRTFFLVGFCALAMPLLSFAQRGGGHGGGGGHPGGGGPAGVGGGHQMPGRGHGDGFAPRGPAVTPHVERSVHGSLRHENTHVTHVPEFRHETHPGVVVGGGHSGFIVHRDHDVDIHRHEFWHDFNRGRRFDRLPGGFLSFNIGGLPFFYYGGTYFQSVPGGYEEVYPPIGAVLTQPPPGSYEVVTPDGFVFYYAGGAFYQQQPDGTFVLVQPPLGVIVPELPPGAVQTVVNGIVVFQFNGIYYQPVFANGVTQYQTFMP